MKTFRPRILLPLLLALTTLWAMALTMGFAPPAFAQEQPHLLDSLEEYQQKLDGLIKERLRAVVPGGNFVVRILVLGKNVAVPRPPQERDATELPGFRRKAVQAIEALRAIGSQGAAGAGAVPQSAHSRGARESARRIRSGPG